MLLLGTAHVVPLRAGIQHHLFDFRPRVVALELDRPRLEGLLAPPGEREKPGVGYGFVAKFQERVAADLGGTVGDEMLAAREAALLLGVHLALVDLPAQQTVKRLVSEMGWMERLRLMSSVVVSLLPGKRYEKDLQRALSGDPDFVDEVTRQYPTVKRVLIDERDEHMAGAIARAAERHRRVAAVLGDAHVPGVEKRLAGRVDAVRTVRLAELAKGVPSQSTWSVEWKQE